MMLDGFDKLIVKLDELIARMSVVGAAAAGARMPDADSAGGFSVTTGDIHTNDAESFVRDFPTLLRQNRYGIRTGVASVLGVT